MKSTPRFDHLHKSLPEPLRTLLLKDTVMELTAAWKFFARLDSARPALLYMSGYSACALSLARHFSRVDVIGPNAEEQALLAEVAAAKNISNLGFLRSGEDLVSAYAAIFLLSDRVAPQQTLLPALLAKLAMIQDGEEEWWIVAREVPRLKITRRGKNFLERWRTHLATKDLPSGLRLLFAPSVFMKVAQLPEMLAQRAPSYQGELRLVPHFSAPKYAVLPFKWKKQNDIFENLRAQKPLPAEHTLLRFSNANAAPSFLQRLLFHLNRGGAHAWQVGRQYRVLPGGKVQIELACDHAAAPALLKLPLIPQAQARMRENANHLVRLAQAKALQPEYRQFFPQSLAEGVFETQAFYLESFLSGRSIDQLPAAQRSPALIDNVFALWFAVQKRMSRRVKITAPLFESVFVDLSERMLAWLKLEPNDRQRLQRVVAHWHKTFAGRELGLGIVHGDFSIKNILVDPGAQKVSGLIDWDLADFFSIPLLDVLHFFVRLDARSFQEAPPAIALRLIRAPEGAARGFFRQAAELHGYEPEDWPAIVTLYWLFRMRGYLGSSKRADAKFMRRQVSEVLTLFEQELLSPRAGVVV